MITFNRAETENNCPVGRESVTRLLPGELCLPEELQASPVLVSLEIWGHVYCGDWTPVKENALILDDIQWPI